MRVPGAAPAAPDAAPRRGTLTRRILAPLLLLLAAALLVAAGYWLARDDSLARLIAVRGQAERDQAAKVGAFARAPLGARFHDGDGARTGPSSTADFVLFTGARLRLKESSAIRFLRRGGRGSFGLSVEVGEVDLTTEDGTLTLDSAFGELVIDADSTVTLRRNGVRLAVAVQLGSVELVGRTLTPGSTVELELGGLVFEPPPLPRAPQPNPPASDEPNLGAGVDGADVVVEPGTDFTIHDPKPPTRVGFRRPRSCSEGALLVIGKLRTEARGQTNLRLPAGHHRYELRCLERPTAVAAEGRFSIVSDPGTRALPTFHPTASVATDGRRYQVLYQQKLPRITVSWPSAPSAPSYELRVDGRAISTTRASYTFQPGALGAGEHTLIFAARTEPPRQSRTTVVAVTYDSQAPTARLAEPASGGFRVGEDVTVAGQALPGWSVSIAGDPAPLDAQGRFTARSKANGALPVAFSHPKHGLHYYIRRPAAE